MKVLTQYPVIIEGQKVNTSDFYVGFDSSANMHAFRDEDGLYYSADGENFYNAKGDKVTGDKVSKLKGFFSKVKGAGKKIGKALKSVSRALVGASKKVAKGVKTVGGKAKSGAKALIHHKKKVKGADAGKAPAGDSALDVLKASAAKSAEEAPDTSLSASLGKKMGAAAPAGGDVFTQKLEQATSSTPADKVVEVDGKKYSTENIPAGKEVVKTTDENGNSIAGVEYQPSEVVAVTGNDGNIEYHTPDNVGGMSKGLKIALFVGGGIALAAILYFALRPKGKTN